MTGNENREELQKLLDVRLRTLQIVESANVLQLGKLEQRFSFEELVPPLALTKRLSERLVLSERTPELPTAFLRTLVSTLENLSTHLERVRTFTPIGNPSPDEARHQLIKNADEALHNVAWQFVGLAGFFGVESPDVQRALSNVESTQANLDAKLEDVEESFATSREHVATLEIETKQILADATKILGDIRAVAGDAALTQHSISFTEAAAAHKRAAGVWLMTAGGVFSLLLLAVVTSPWWTNLTSGTYDPQTVQKLIAKVVAVSIIYYGAVFSLKNYRAHRHLQEANEHRERALKTFRAFADSAKGIDVETQRAVLLEASRSIFTATPSGYLGAGEDEPTPMRILEVTKSFGGKG